MFERVLASFFLVVPISFRISSALETILFICLELTLRLVPIVNLIGAHGRTVIADGGVTYVVIHEIHVDAGIIVDLEHLPLGVVLLDHLGLLFFDSIVILRINQLPLRILLLKFSQISF